MRGCGITRRRLRGIAPTSTLPASGERPGSCPKGCPPALRRGRGGEPGGPPPPRGSDIRLDTSGWAYGSRLTRAHLRFAAQSRGCSHYNHLNLLEKISTQHGLRAFSRCFTWQDGRPAPLDAFLRAISVNTSQPAAQSPRQAGSRISFHGGDRARVSSAGPVAGMPAGYRSDGAPSRRFAGFAPLGRSLSSSLPSPDPAMTVATRRTSRASWARPGAAQA